MYTKQDPSSIRTLFASIAKRYDVGNAVLSMRLFRRWNAQLVSSVITAKQPKVLLDLCCGTGDIAFTYLRHAEHPPEAVYMIDFCPEMLRQARMKSEGLSTRNTSIHYIVGDAQDIPLPDASVDCVTIAYGIRNVANPAKCFGEVFRVLRPGGSLGILELTRPRNPLMRLGHTLYLKAIVPVVGRFLTSNRQAYDYLQSSIRHFIPAEDLRTLLLEAGFQNASVTPLSGGIATLLSAERWLMAK